MRKLSEDIKLENRELIPVNEKLLDLLGSKYGIGRVALWELVLKMFRISDYEAHCKSKEGFKFLPFLRQDLLKDSNNLSQNGILKSKADGIVSFNTLKQPLEASNPKKPEKNTSFVSFGNTITMVSKP